MKAFLVLWPLSPFPDRLRVGFCYIRHTEWPGAFIAAAHGAWHLFIALNEKLHNCQNAQLNSCE